MARNVLRTGKQTRPKTAFKGKRYRCAMCRKRSPKPVKRPAPWYCANCTRQKTEDAITDKFGSAGGRSSFAGASGSSRG